MNVSSYFKFKDRQNQSIVIETREVITSGKGGTRGAS